MDPVAEQEEQPEPATTSGATRTGNQLKWRSQKQVRRSAKPYDRRPATQQPQDREPQQQSMVSRITSSVSSIIPAWIRGAASGFLLPVDPIPEQVEHQDTHNEGPGGEEEVAVIDDDEDEAENQAPDPRITSSDSSALLNRTANHRPIDQLISDPLSPFDPSARNRYPMTSTARKTKITTSTASRLEKQLAKSKAKIQQNVDLDLEDEVPDEASAAGPSHPLVRGADCVDDDRSSTSENTASSTSGCSSLVPSHQDHHTLQPQQQQPDQSLNNNNSAFRQNKIQFPTDQIERLRLELMRKKQGTASGRTSLQSFDGPPSRPPSSISGQQSIGQPASSSNHWLPGNRSGSTTFGTAFSRPGSSLMAQSSFSITARSPFYEGRTSYGGSSARRAARLVNSNPYSRGARIPPVLHVRVADRSSNGEEHLSEAARKILESMSSPLQEAKKIPLNESQGLSNRSLYQSYNRPSSALGSSGISTAILNRSNPPVVPVKDQSHRLNWPIDLKDFVDKKKQKRTVSPEVTSAETSDTSRLSVVDASAGAAGGKMKSSLSSARLAQRDDRESDETLESMSQACGLPHVSLPPLKSLPTINFSANKIGSTSSTISGTTGSISPSVPRSEATSVLKPLSSSPSVASVKPVASPVQSTAVNEFPFSSPTPSSRLSRSQHPTKEVPKTNVPVVVESVAKGFAFASNAGTKTASLISQSVSDAKSGPKSTIAPSTSESKSSVAFQNSVKKTGLETSAAFAFTSTPKEQSESWASKNNTSFSSTEKGTRRQDTPVTSSLFAQSSKQTDVASRVVTARKDASPADSRPTSGPSPPVQQFKFAAPVSGSWTCPICLIANSPDKNVCAACEAIKPNPSAPRTSTLASKPSARASEKPVLSSFPASNSTIERKAEETPVPKTVTPAAPAQLVPANPAPIASAASAWDSSFKKPSSGWTCSSCLVPNQDKDLECVCCSERKPGAPAPEKAAEPKPTFSFGIPAKTTEPVVTLDKEISGKAAPSIFGNSVFGSGSAPTFGHGTFAPAPAVPPVTTTSSTASISSTSGWGSSFKPSSAGWTCSSCLVSNKDDVTVCVCCSERKPGTEPPVVEKPESKPVFSFGTPAKPAFGGVSSMTTAPATPSTASFSFGGSVPATASATPAKSMFGSVAAVTTASTSSPFSAPAFSFGSAAATASTATPAKSAFSFVASTPTFGAGTTAPTASSTTVPSKPTFNFGGTSASTTSALTPAKSTFSFGATTPAFGASNPVPTATTVASSPFSFGSSTPTSVSQAPAVSATPTVPTFNFGASAPSTPSTSSTGFAFGGKSVFGGTGAFPQPSLMPPPSSVTGTTAGAAPAAGPAGLQMPSTPATPVFNFGSGSGSTSTPVVFGAGAQSMGTPFSFTADASDASTLNSGATGERRIRKAKRRLK